MCLLEGVGRHSPIFLKLQESWSKVGHAAREMVRVYSVTIFCNSILSPTSCWEN